MRKRESIQFLMASMLLGGLHSNERYGPPRINYKDKPPLIPKGCKEYVFNESFGELRVIAINEKSALKKYNKWCSIHPPKPEQE